MTGLVTMSDDDGEMLLKDWTVAKSLQKMERRRNLETTIVGLVCVAADGLVRSVKMSYTLSPCVLSFI